MKLAITQRCLFIGFPRLYKKAVGKAHPNVQLAIGAAPVHHRMVMQRDQMIVELKQRCSSRKAGACVCTY